MFCDIGLDLGSVLVFSGDRRPPPAGSNPEIKPQSVEAKPISQKSPKVGDPQHEKPARILVVQTLSPRFLRDQESWVPEGSLAGICWCHEVAFELVCRADRNCKTLRAPSI
jgi:hypothetical protein